MSARVAPSCALPRGAIRTVRRPARHPIKQNVTCCRSVESAMGKPVMRERLSFFCPRWPEQIKRPGKQHQQTGSDPRQYRSAQSKTSATLELSVTWTSRRTLEHFPHQRLLQRVQRLQLRRIAIKRNRTLQVLPQQVHLAQPRVFRGNEPSISVRVLAMVPA
jgi:hypothetical protein